MDSARTMDELRCSELVELVSDYLEERLTADDRRRFDQHLEGCGGCRTYVEQLRATVQLVGRLREEDLDPAARETLLRAFRDWKGDAL